MSRMREGSWHRSLHTSDEARPSLGDERQRAQVIPCRGGQTVSHGEQWLERHHLACAVAEGSS